MEADKITQAIHIMADYAEKLGADANDDSGIVRSIVQSNGLGFNAWFCVCIELGHREARREGFKDQFDRAASHMTSRERR